MKNELKVGIFTFIAIVFLFFLTTQVGSFKNLSKKGYTIYTLLDNAAGLEKNSKVKANGIDVGFIESLNIEGQKIKAKIFINEGVKLPKDSVLSPTQESMLGGKYAAISLGSSQEFLNEGDTIKSSKGLASINEASDSMAKAADEFKAFIVDFREVFDRNSRESLQKTFTNLESITDELKKFMKLEKLTQTADNFNNMALSLSKTSDEFDKTAKTINERLPQIMKNLDKLVSDLRETSTTLRSKIPLLADKFAKIGDELSQVINENRDPLNSTLKSADSFFDLGEDTFKKVDDLLATIDKVQLEVAMYGEWMQSDAYAKGHLSLDYRPSDTKSYKFDIVGMDDYSRLTDSGELVPPKKHEESKLLVSAQIAKRFGDVRLRGGLIESTFGAGVDYYLFNDLFQTSFELFDMNAQNDVRGEEAHAKVSARWTFLKHLDLYGGVDNFLNSDATNSFIGLGVRFYDDDLKTLIISQGLSGLAK
jgi:phospholipid/cholesterol/gamma-HCH transport system substrate-binding protein